MMFERGRNMVEMKEDEDFLFVMLTLLKFINLYNHECTY